MKTRNMQILYKLFIMLVLAMVASCGTNGSQSASTGDITAKLAWNPSEKTTAKTVASAPAGVTTVRIIISGADMTTILKDFTAASGSGTIDGVLPGTARTLTAQGLDGTGAVIYQGTAANLTVQAGQTTNAGIITMVAIAATYSQLSFSTSTLNFADQAYLTTSPAKTVTLTNNSNAPAYIDIWTSSGAGVTYTSADGQGSARGIWYNGDFHFDHLSGPVLAAGESVTISVTFRPTTSGARVQKLNVISYANQLFQTSGGVSTVTTLTLNGNSIDTSVATPTITGISPSTGTVGTTVTITGTNFSTTSANNTVKFNGTQATVTTATATSLTVTVPSGATTGTVSVTTTGGTATSAGTFTVTADFSGASAVCKRNSVCDIGGIQKDSAGAPVAGATVAIVVNGTKYTTTSDANGIYDLVLPSNITSYLPDTFSYSVFKTGYVPITYIGHIDTTIYQATTPLVIADDSYVVLEIEPLTHHLGDSSFSGVANSQFQYPEAEGLSWSKSFNLTTQPTLFQNGNLTLQGKGLQCPDKLTINSTAYVFPNSDLNGGYSPYTVKVPSSAFKANQSNTLTISSSSATCTGYDDFEFQNVVIKFDTATTSTLPSNTGKWVGTWQWSGEAAWPAKCSFADGGVFSMTITQSGSSISGSTYGEGMQWRNTSTCALADTRTGTGSVSGTTSASGLNLSSFSLGSLNFSGTATINGNTLTGTFVSGDSQWNSGSGTFTLTKQ